MQDRELLNLYFRDITPSEPLSSEEETQLARQIREGDLSARDRLVSANLRFVVLLAREYKNCGVPLPDLIGAGNMGLIIAAERFDETRGFRFISYAACWIRNCILQTLSQNAWLVRLPLNRIGLLKKITRVSRRLLQAHGDEPEPAAIAEQLNVSVEMVRDTLMRAQGTWSIDATYWENDRCSLLDELVEDEGKSPEARLVEASVHAHVKRAMDALEEREGEVLRLYFGLDGDDPLTLEEIGGRLSLTRERVRQIKERAINRLRHPRLRAHLDALRSPV